MPVEESKKAYETNKFQFTKCQSIGQWKNLPTSTGAYALMSSLWLRPVIKCKGIAPVDPLLTDLTADVSVCVAVDMFFLPSSVSRHTMN